MNVYGYRVDEEEGSDVDGMEGDNSEDATLFWAHAIRGEGQKFENADSFRRAIKNHCIAIRRGFKYVKNEKGRVTVHCSMEGCGWRIHASHHKSDQSFRIRTSSLEHTCGVNNLRDRHHPKADANWVAGFMKEKLRRDPTYKPNAVIDDIHAAFAVEISYRTAWCAREIAMKEINGANGNAFDKLRWFCNALKETNPGSVADLEVYPESSKFRRVFIAISACVLGFKEGCRPMIFIDGAFIKSKWKGCLLSAVAKDGNGGFLTLAFAGTHVNRHSFGSQFHVCSFIIHYCSVAVVDAENDQNWEWFCSKLRTTIIGGDEDHNWDSYTFFSDRHSGLLKAIPAVFEGSKHAICLRHLVDNFRTQVRCTFL